MRRVPAAVALLLVLAPAAAGQSLVLYSSAIEQPTPKDKDGKQPPPKIDDKKPADPKPPTPIDQAFAQRFARGIEAGGFAARTYNPNFDGDNVGVFYRRQVLVGFDRVAQVVGFNQTIIGANQRQVGTTPRVIGTTQTVVPDASNPNGFRIVTTPVVVQDPVFVLDPVIGTTPVTANVLVPRTTTVQLPAASRYNGVQITDNDNPRPTDRVYFGYNFYSDVGASLNPTLGGSDVQRQMAGFEMTFLDGDASVGMRLPYIQQYGPAGLGSQTVGDLSVIFKYAFWNDLETGDLASAGVMITAPTGGGSGIILADGSALPHSTLFQPWGGFVRMYDAGYVQGISNLIVPSDSRDPVLWGNSLAAGYFLYRNPAAGFITDIIPKAEVHIRTPLSQRDPNGLVYLMDQVNVNAGLVVRAGRASLSGSVSVPVAGPRPWGVEAISFFNYTF